VREAAPTSEAAAEEGPRQVTLPNRPGGWETGPIGGFRVRISGFGGLAAHEHAPE
jgi:hypothetical protein